LTRTIGVLIGFVPKSGIATIPLGGTLGDMKKIHRSALSAASLVVVLTLAGCAGATTGMPGMDHGGGMPTPSVTVQGEFNAADSMFATMMIPHHAQAIEMSDMILAKSGIDQAVLDLAQQIKDAQGPEIELMESWLDDWGMPSSGGMGGMDHGDGMMSQEDMDQLGAADGPEAARVFLEQMIVHHEGAIDMAEDELSRGANPDVRALAESIIESQTAEIATMRELLAQL
jgi:uncharacterized protein (DUF305 family)